jgi:hypothetical protein
LCAADVIRLCHVVPVLSLTVDGGLAGGASMETLAKAKQEQDDWQHVKVCVLLCALFG